MTCRGCRRLKYPGRSIEKASGCVRSPPTCAIKVSTCTGRAILRSERFCSEICCRIGEISASNLLALDTKIAGNKTVLLEVGVQRTRLRHRSATAYAQRRCYYSVVWKA